MQPSLTSAGIGHDPVSHLRDTYLGQSVVQVRTSPLRRAFLVRDGDIDALRDALRAAATIWGGMRCPILCVHDDGRVCASEVQIAEVMGVVEVVDFTRRNSSEGCAWIEAGSSMWPVIPARPLDDGTFWTPHPLVTHDESWISKTRIFLPTQDDDSLVSLAGAGQIALQDERDRWKQSGVALHESSDEVDLACAQLNETTAFAATTRSDNESAINSLALDTVCFLWATDDPNSFEDLVSFWNRRALRPRIWNSGPSLIVSNKTLNSEKLKKIYGTK